MNQLANFGVCIFPTEHILTPSQIAIIAEKNNLDYLFLAENSHIPITNTAKKYYNKRTFKLFGMMYDPIISLSACAAVTNRIKLGTGVCLLTERDPIITAKAIATLDHLSKGRILFGVAGGWIKEAMENHGACFQHRWAIVEEHIELIKKLWKSEEIKHEGRFFKLHGPVKQYPKPYQKGGPPILIGSNHKSVTEKVARYANGWMPIHNRYERKSEPLLDLKEECKKQSKNYQDMMTILFDAPKNPYELVSLFELGYKNFVFFPTRQNDYNCKEFLEETSDIKKKFFKLMDS